jgi:H+-transporting ATPase
MASNVEKEPGPQGENPTPTANTEPEKKKREYKDFEHDNEAPTRTWIVYPDAPP